jgi:6-pyruvoyltetrahydropterin/6-carboxytetrahydropterin synthase
MKYKTSVEKNTLRFAAAHLTTSQGQAEPLHGHNYTLLVEVEGDLSEDAWVMDFGELKRIAGALCQQLDHRLLLPHENPALKVTDLDNVWQIAAGDRRYVIPKSDVYLLPLDNSTAERLAEWFCHRLAQALAERGNITSITVGVEEAPGQAGWCTLNVSNR